MNIDVNKIIETMGDKFWTTSKHSKEFVINVLHSVNDVGIKKSAIKYNISENLVSRWVHIETARKNSKNRYKKKRKKFQSAARDRYVNNKEKMNKYSIQYQKEHPHLIKQWNDKNKDKVKTYRRKYRKHRFEDPTYKIIKYLRNRIYFVIKNQSTTKEETTLELTGCSPSQLKSHLESLFQEGMSWDNYGVHGWHIDHIIPCASFDLTNPDEQRKCFHYTNLQPLWAVDNLSKGSKID